ncbi:SGNH/GDSL hydrolase family protein [Carboxylicivirga marina]|uniref:SGNH/GDSL hydrolase family protein n=1 Tax=Carboxylicivirga marina TaxID=2800988 RepID=UPI002593BEC3|nr:SGNH/GDSL hydrolase family protein [uncultured Carboxylicivirga sp.]
MKQFFLSTVNKGSNFTPLDATIVNLGESGNSTGDLINRLSSVSAENPDLVIIMVGTNDLLNSAKLNDLDTYEANLNTIISSISVYADILFMNVLPCWEPYVYSRHTYPNNDLYNNNTLNEVVNLGNERIAKVVGKNGLYFYDANARLKANGDPKEDVNSFLRNQNNSPDDDGIHPTANGHNAIGLGLFETLKKRKISANKIVTFGDSITYGVHVAGEGTTTSSAANYSGRLKYYLENQ